jgi:hypothetical protein
MNSNHTTGELGCFIKEILWEGLGREIDFLEFLGGMCKSSIKNCVPLLKILGLRRKTGSHNVKNIFQILKSASRQFCQSWSEKCLKFLKDSIQNRMECILKYLIYV